MYCFSIALNSSTLYELSKIICLLLYCSKRKTDGMVCFSQYGKFLSRRPAVQDHAEQPEADDHDFDLPVHHQFGAYFSHKTDTVVLVDGCSTINKYYKPESLIH